MFKKKKKLALFLTMTTFLTPLSLVAAACGTTTETTKETKPNDEAKAETNNESKPESKAESTTQPAPAAETVPKQLNSNQYVVNVAAPLSLKPYDLDYSTKISTTLDRDNLLETLGAGNLMRIATDGQASYDKDGKTLKTYAKMRLVLELAKAIIVKKQDGTIVTFDNDKAEVDDNSKNKKGYYFLSSKDPKSINSPEYTKALENAQSVSFKMRDNIYWVDSKGNKTEYKLRAKDFQYSLLRSMFQGYPYRSLAKYGGSNAADAKMREEMNGEQIRFQPDYLFTKIALFYTFKVDPVEFRKMDSKKTVNEANDTLTFYSKDNNGADFNQFLDLLIVKSKVFAAAPSEYIDKIVKTSDPKFKAHDLAVAGSDVKKLGIYRYGVSGAQDNLYIGAYVPTQINSNSIVFEKNKHFVDTKFVNESTNAQKVVINYGVNNTSSLSQFKQNSLTTINFDSLQQADKNYIIQNFDKYKVDYIKPYVNNASLNRTANLVNPQPAPDAFVSSYKEDGTLKDPQANQNYAYSFNDGFAKLMWNKSVADLKKAENYGISKHLYQSYGLSFKSIIQAAINWEYLARQFEGPKYRSWTAQVAPDSAIGGSDQATSTFKTPADAFEEINTLFAVDKDGRKIANSEVTPSQNAAKITANATQSEAMKSASYETLKAAMKTLLDAAAADQTLNMGQDFKVEWEIINSKVINNKQKELYGLVAQTINGLDSRLGAKFKFLETPNDVKNYINTFKHNARRFSVSYDFDGVGSFLDKISHDTGLSPWAMYKVWSEKDENSADNAFPELTKMAKELKRQVESGEFKMPANGQWDQWDKFLSELESQIYLSYELTNDNPKRIKYVGINGMAYQRDENWEYPISNVEEYAKFGLKYQRKLTNEQLIKLVKEVTIVRGFPISAEYASFAPQYVTTKVSQKGVSIPSPIDGIIYVQDIKFSK